MAKKRDVEVLTGLKIISVLYYIVAVLMILYGVVGIFGAGILSTIQLGALGIQSSIVIVIVSVILLALGIFGVFLGRGLWKAQNWARLVAGIIAVILFIISIIAIVSGGITNIISTIIQGIIAWYLLLNNNVKRAIG